MIAGCVSLRITETARAALESEHHALKVSTASAEEEKTSLLNRISSLETSHRDNISLLESKSNAYDTLAHDLSTEHQKNVELRRQISASEQDLQSASSKSTNAKYREQALEQELEQLRRSNDWFSNELKEKAEEHSRFRREKNSRISELQRVNEDLSNTIEALQRVETTLRSRLKELEQKLEDHLQRIQQLQEQAASKDEEFQIELNSANRLAELMKNSSETEKRRQQELLEELDEVKQAASEEIARIVEESETEHREREAAESRVIELETRVEECEGEMQKLRGRTQGSSPSPQANGYMTPNRQTPLSRLASPTPGKARGGISMTQLVSDYNTVKSELDEEQRRNEKLSQTVDDMLSDMENRQPEVAELREDHARLQAEIGEMGSLIDSIGKERDEAVKDARKQTSLINSKVREGELLRQQLRDLSSQVKVLLMEIHLRDQGQDEITEQNRLQLERLAQGQVDESELNDTTATDRFISQNLVTFRNVSELEEQNSKLVTLTRELGQKMEEEEVSKRGATETARVQQELQEKYERCKDEIKSLVTQSQSYIRERDMFRRMLSHRGQLPANADMESIFGESVNGDGPMTPSRRDLVSDVDHPSSTKDLADYAKLLKDMQSHFDAYRQETAADRSTLKDQIDTLSRNNIQLRGEVNKSNSQVELTNERYDMIQANYKMLQSENAELQKRSHFHAENTAKLDLRSQQAAEDLIEAKGLVDSMRKESAVLKAEKDFWKTVEKRLTDDNQNLQAEQSRLNAMNTDLQRVLNEREFSENDSRRRLQEQVDKLEQDARSAQKRLDNEVEENKQVLLRREFENQQNQKRIDDLVSSLGSTRETLVSTKTSRDHLQNRVEELMVELRSAEERLETLRTTSTHRHSDQIGSAGASDSAMISGNPDRESELAAEISELKRDLDLARKELENAKSQTAQFKAISQSSEEELASLNETQEMYRQETDRLLEERKTKIEQLTGRLDDTSSELSTSNAEIARLRDAEIEMGRRLDEQSSTYESELSKVKDSAERYEAAAQFLQADLRSQTTITQQAQSNYEDELVKHGATAKTLHNLRNELSQLKIEVLESRGELESTRASLSQNEENWNNLKDRYERELSDIRAGRENLQVQNGRLHQQLEHLSAQISGLQKHAPTAEQDASTSDTPPLNGSDNSQEIIKYLRREKEIVDVQLEISSQEGKRVKQQLQYTQSQLDEVRLRLNQQRRLEEENERSALNHNKLMETLNELSTFRESNVTLRNEARQAQAALASKKLELEQLQAQMEPLNLELREVKGELENALEESRLVTEDRDRWQQRAQTILQKYDRIDPAELEALKVKIASLEKEREEIGLSTNALQTRIEEAEKQTALVEEQGNEKLNDLRQRLRDQFKSRDQDMRGKLRDKDTELQTALQDKGKLEQQVTSLQSQMEVTKAERDEAVEKAAQTTGNDGDGSHSEEGQVNESDDSVNVPEDSGAIAQAQVAEAQAKADEAATKLAGIESQIHGLQSTIANLESQLDEKQKALDSSAVELEQLRGRSGQQNADSADPSMVESQLKALQQQLLDAQKANEDLRTALATTTSTTDTTQASEENGTQDVVAANAEDVRAELERRHSQRMTELEEDFKKRTDSMRIQLSRKLAEGKAEARKTIGEEFEKKSQTLRTAHTQEVEALNARHQSELDELQRTLDERFETYKTEWQAKHTDQQPAGAGQHEIPQVDGEGGPLPHLSEDQSKKLVASNATIKEMVRRNILQGIQKTKEANAAQVKQDCEQECSKKLSEMQQKAAKEKDQAVFMETKRNALKVSMAENRGKNVQAQIEIVQTAAKDTPEKPVGEVWAVAKDRKAPQGMTTAQKPAAITNASPNAGVPAANQAQAPSPQVAASAKAEGTNDTQIVPNDSKSPSLNPSAQAFSPTQNQAAVQQQPQAPNDSQVQQKPFPQSQGNGIPRPVQSANNPQARPPGQPNTAAGRGNQQSGIPMARGSIRGRGRGQSRGAPQNIDTTRIQGQAAGQGRGSPTGRAKQFVPGNKRPRDDGGDGGQGGDGKRIRGGGGDGGGGGGGGEQ